MTARLRAQGTWVRSLLATGLGLATAAIVLAPATAQAADANKAREKMVELNKEALLRYERKEWDAARELLSQALQEAMLAGLEGNNMTARTYVHLGCVQWTGFHDKAAALRSFALAKQIRPDIQLTPLLETPELRAVFDLASDENAVPGAGSAAPPTPSTTGADGDHPASVGAGGGGEPRSPADATPALMCSLPAIAAPHRELTIRCTLPPGLEPSRVEMHFRTHGIESYQTLGMQRGSDGWYKATLPASAMKPGMLQVYFDARDGSDNELASNGQIDSPSVVAVRKRGSGRAPGDDDDPMSRINEMVRAEAYEAGLHRRREGALWLSIGGGLGWGYAPAGKLEWQKNIQVSSLTANAGRFHLLPEIGYMVSDNFGLAVQGRLEFIQQQQATDPRTGDTQPLAANLTGAPTTMAAAGFARAIGYTDISAGGNVRLSYSLDLGGGFVRLPVKPVAVMKYNPEKNEDEPDYDRTIAKTDTRPLGAFLGGASVGLLWNLSRRFAFSLEGRVLTGLPNWGAVVEGGLALQLAFGGQHGVAPSAEEQDSGWEDERPDGSLDDEWAE